MTIDYISPSSTNLFGGSGGAGGSNPSSIDWNTSVSNATLDSVVYPILGQDHSDPLGLSSYLPNVGATHAPESVGQRVASLANVKLAQLNALGKILSVSLGEKAKTTYTTSEVQNMLLTAFRQAGEAGATTLSDYLVSKITQAQASGQPTGGVHIISAPKVQQTVYSAADIQATADAVGQKLIGRKLDAAEMQGVLAIMNSASAAKAQADVAGVESQQQADISTSNAVYGGGQNTSAAGGSSANTIPPPQTIYQMILSAGGSPTQAAVGAALTSGIESSTGAPIGELSGGVGPAAGLFQFEPGTWTSNGGPGGAVGNASIQQQIQVFLNATKGNNFGAWGPDLVANSGDPNSSSNPAYGYSGAPQPGSKVANAIARLGLGGGISGGDASGSAAGGSTGQTTDIYQTPVVNDVPATPDQTEAATNFLETQRAPEYQANNLLNIFQMIQSKLASPDPSLNPHVLSGPVSMK